KRKRRSSGYTQRWQVETVMSMIKRNQGEELSGEGYHSRNRQMRMLAEVHNILDCYLFGRFATEQTCPLLLPGAAIGGGVAGGVLAAGSATVGVVSTSSTLMTNLLPQGVVAFSSYTSSTLHSAAVSGYSKETELRADANGLRYLWAAGYKPHAALDVLEKVKELETGAAKEAKLTSLSHYANCEPKLAERSKCMNEVLNSLPK
ncbi:MAG: hypothetical protein NTW19_16805, partial [Planctomycetota bacterium]|nr:hypothetical protein [Planctomycetota bacterium]